MRLRRVSRGDSGASAVEFALVVPLLLLIVFGIINFGTLFSQQLTINNGVREGARRAVVADPAAPRSCDQIITSVRNQLSGIALDTAQVQVKVSQNGWSDGASSCGSGFVTTNFGANGAHIPCTNSYNAADHSGSLVVEAKYELEDPGVVPAVPDDPRDHIEGGVPVRVHVVTNRPSPLARGGDRGAVAIMVGILMTVFLLLAAFAIDIGNAYANARQLSVAADAASLSAAAKVGEAYVSAFPNAACDLANLTAINATQIAQTQADLVNTQNNKSGVNEPVGPVVITCENSNKSIQVSIKNNRQVKTGLGA
jgi:Flp pilus assembly protein TadG